MHRTISGAPPLPADSDSRHQAPCRAGGEFVPVTLHSGRGRQAIDAAGVLPASPASPATTAWKPCDSYDGVG